MGSNWSNNLGMKKNASYKKKKKKKKIQTNKTNWLHCKMHKGTHLLFFYLLQIPRRWAREWLRLGRRGWEGEWVGAVVGDGDAERVREGEGEWGWVRVSESVRLMRESEWVGDWKREQIQKYPITNRPSHTRFPGHAPHQGHVTPTWKSRLWWSIFRWLPPGNNATSDVTDNQNRLCESRFTRPKIDCHKVEMLLTQILSKPDLLTR